MRMLLTAAIICLSLPILADDLSSQILANYRRSHPLPAWSYNWTTAIFLYGAGQSALDGVGSMDSVRSALVAIEKSRPEIDSPDLAAMSLAANIALDGSNQNERPALLRIIESSKKFFATERLNVGGVFDHVGSKNQLKPWLPPSSWVVPSSVWADSSIMYAVNGLLIAIRENNSTREAFFTDQLLKIHTYLWDSKAQLYKHAYYFGSQSFAPTTGFWARGNLWMSLSFLRAAENLPVGSQARAKFEALLRNHVASLSKHTDFIHGLRTLLDQPDDSNAYETTASALFAYVLMRGARDGILTVNDSANGHKLALGLHAVLKRVSPAEISVTGISCPTTATPWAWYYTHVVGECLDESYGVGSFLMMLAEEKHL